MSNPTYTAIFYLFAAITVFSAAFVVFSRNVIYSAFALLFTFFGVAALYVFLSADFIAVTQVVVYVGGILVLLLFGVMFTNNIMDTDLKTDVIACLARHIPFSRPARRSAFYFLYHQRVDAFRNRSAGECGGEDRV